jgi:ABC-type uncharacterized transport system permease subunit
MGRWSFVIIKNQGGGVMIDTILEFISEGNRVYIGAAILVALIVLFILDRKKAQKIVKGIITLFALFIAAMVAYSLYNKARTEGDFERMRTGDTEKESTNPKYYQDLDKKYNLDQQ